MEKERAIALLDETIDRYRAVTSDDLEEVAMQVRQLRDTATSLTQQIRDLPLDGEVDSSLEQQADAIEDGEAIYGWADDIALELDRLVEKLNR